MVRYSFWTRSSNRVKATIVFPSLTFSLSVGYTANGQSVENCIIATGFSGPLKHYNGLIRDGALREDPQQKAVIEKLEEMQNTLKGYSNQPTSLFSKVSTCHSLVIIAHDVPAY